MTDKPTFEMNIDTRMIYDRLKEAVVGEVVSYKTLSNLLGRPVEGCTPNLQSALRRLESEGIAFGGIVKIGYKRLTDIEVVQTAETFREGIRRKARRAVKKLACVGDFERLPNDMKIKHNAAMSGFGAIAAMMTPARMKGLETQVERAREQLPLAKTLEAFKA